MCVKWRVSKCIETFAEGYRVGRCGQPARVGWPLQQWTWCEEGRGKSKAKYFYEQAAIGGHPDARHKLGRIEWDNGEHERAIKHLMIAT